MLNYNTTMSYLKKIGFYFCICYLPAPALLADTVVDASLKALHFDYEEFDQSGATFNKETGVIPGFSIAASKKLNHFTNTLSFESYDGEVDYDGQLQSGAPHMTQTQETLNRVLYKLNWSPNNNNNSIFGKIAWQQWDRNILPTNSVSGLFEQYEWWAIEIGFLATIYENNTSRWQFELGISKIDNGTIEIDLIDQGFGQPKLELGDGQGVAAQLIYRHTFMSSNALSISLQHQRWTFGRSNTESISNGFNTFEITEPRSESNHSILSFNYHHYF